MITFLIAPPFAKALAGAGYTKQMIATTCTSTRACRIASSEFLIEYGHSEAFKIPDMVERGLMPKEYLVKPD
jgi:hypothetical protein